MRIRPPFFLPRGLPDDIIVDAYNFNVETAMEKSAREILTNGTWRKHQGLQNAKELMKLLGDPQDEIPCVHVAGTNGKGSAAAYISSILTEAGYKTGLNTSPYLQVFNERFRINGRNISDADIDRYFEPVYAAARKMDDRPNEFELITALAFEYFAGEKCDVSVIEVGMGGIDDATNVIGCPMCAVLMNIGLEHTKALGNTLTEIAEKKAGIIKPGTEAVVYSQTPEVMEVFRRKCTETGAEYNPVDFSRLELISSDLHGQVFDFKRYKNIYTPLLGRHQLKNAAMAITTAESLRKGGFEIPDSAIASGIENVDWPARFEVISKNPIFIIDGGHNPQGAEATRQCIEDYLGERHIVLLTGILADKDYRSVYDRIDPVVSEYVCTTVPGTPRAMEAGRLKDFLSGYGKPVTLAEDPESAILEAKSLADRGGAAVVFGSIYLAGAVRNVLRPLPREGAGTAQQ